MSEPEEDFAAMFEASLKAKRVEKGQTIEGTIVAIGPEVAFVDVGGKGEATIEIAELKDADGDLEVAVGDRIQAMVVSTVGGLTLSRKLVRGAATAAAARRRVPHRPAGRRQSRTGGEGRLRGAHRRPARLLPVLADRHRSGTDPSAHEGRVYEFRIIEYKEGGKNLVVSRRALLEEEQRASAAEVRRSIVAGAVMTGRVASVREFGAFVDLGGGVQGLLHVSEMGWSRVSDTSQVVKPGEEITVKVLRVDDDKQKISLGLKQLTADPWSRVQRHLRSRPGASPAASRASPSSARSSSSSRASKGWRTPRRSRRPGDRRLVHASVAPGMTGGVRDPEHRSREEADRRGARSGRLRARRRRRRRARRR